MCMSIPSIPKREKKAGVGEGLVCPLSLVAGTAYLPINALNY